MRRWLGSLVALLVAACATSAPDVRAPGQTPSWPTLARFSSENEFLAYLDAVQDARRAQLSLRPGKQNAETQIDAITPADLCPPEDPDCFPDLNLAESLQRLPGVSVSAPTNSQITNVQTAGVDEGDIVKMIGRFLIVLQDGRLFSIDTGSAATELALTDRANVYRSSAADTWYDEILVHGSRIVVTGYNYGRNTTEYSVFSLSPSGRFTREGVYFMSSDDYYDVDNYATRLVDGNLVVYTALDVSDMHSGNTPRWPLVRRWLREDQHGAVSNGGRQLFGARDIYRPIQTTLTPRVHTISVCPLGSDRAGDELECRSTAIAGSDIGSFYVSNDHVYLWLWTYDDPHPDGVTRARCAARTDGSFAYAGEAALFQIGLDDGRPRAMFVRGAPINQLGMEATANSFRALTAWRDYQCGDWDNELALRYLLTPLSGFSTTPVAAHETLFTPLPAPGGRGLENRFTADHLVYGGRGDWSSYPPEGDEARTGSVVVLPGDDPSAAAMIETPHSIIRIESIGRKAVLTGYRDEGALSISLLDLRDAPRLANTVALDGRYESEGRSHAFNAAVDADGAGLVGLPTVEARDRSGRWWWDSEASDVSFLSLDGADGMHSLGALESDADAQHPAYVCEVSCIDWYGNSRPIFVGRRIFALSGAELIEGKVEGGRIVERGRVNLTAPPRLISSR